MTPTAAQQRFAGFVATLGRGPGRSRALTRDEAREAFGLLLSGAADPHQAGAFLMLLRYRGEDADEIAGIVEAARDGLDLACLEGAAGLDWPSYGAGRTRGAPWFLLAALALAQGGVKVLMHGGNRFSAGIPADAALAALGLAAAEDAADAARRLGRDGFAYLPLDRLAPALDRLLMLRALLGLRSPVNTAVRLLDPARAAAGIDGVFHPPYIAVHLGVAERLGRPRLLVLKGGGGEAERNPAKPLAGFLWTRGEGCRELVFPALATAPAERAQETPALLGAVWRGEAAAPLALATVKATLGAALVAAGRVETPAAADAEAAQIWVARRPLAG